MSAARALRRLGRAAGVGVLILVLLVVAALASLDTAAGRAFVVSEVNDVLARTFEGKVVIRRIAHVGLGGARGVEATIENPSGLQVARTRVARADIDTFALIRSFFLTRSGPRIVELTHVDIEDSELRLDTDASGKLELLDALEPVHANESPERPGETSRGIRVALDEVTLRHGRVHRTGRLGPVRLDADLDDVRGSVVYTPEATQVELRDGRVQAHEALGDADLTGHVRAHLRVPGEPDALPEAHLEWTGVAGAIRHTLVASMAHRHIDVVLRSQLGDGTLDGDAHATIGRRPEDLAVEGSVRAHDVDLRELFPQAPPTRIGLVAVATGSGKQIRFHLDADARTPARAAPEMPSCESAHAETSGVVDLADATVAAELTGRAHHLVKGRDRVQSLAVRASAEGPLAHPDLDAGVSAQGVVAAGKRVTSAWLTAKGSPTKARITASLRSPDLPDVDARADAEMTHGIALRGVEVDVNRGDQRARANVRTVKLSAGRVSVEDATLHASAPDIGNLDVTVPKLAVGGGSPASASWRQATGVIDVEMRADLGRLTALFPADSLPVSDARGKVAVRAHVERRSPTDPAPTLSLGIETDNLVLAPRVPVERDIDLVLVHPRPRWRLEGIDFAIDALLGGKTRELRGAVQAHDAKGEIAELYLTSAHFPSIDLLGDAGRLERMLRTTDVDVTLEVPGRGLGSLPPILRQHYVTGRVRGKATLRGSLERPKVEVSAEIAHALFGGTGEVRPMNVDLEARYDGLHGSARAEAKGDGHELLEIESAFEAAASDLLGGTGAGRWSGSARAHVQSFPLQTVAALDDRQVAGALTGDVTLEGLHRDAHLDASLSVDGLAMGGVAYRSARADLTIDGHAMNGDVRVEQNDGFLDARVRAPSSWGARVLPALERTSPLEGKLDANDFRLAALQPFVDATFDELDGRLTTSDLQLELDPRTRRARMAGKVVVSRGAIEAATAGGELHDLEATVRFDTDGTITLDKLNASGVEGRVEAKGTARVQGLALASAHATITIPGNGAIPLTVGGVELGRVDGDVDISAEAGPSGGVGAVKVDARRLNVKLSQASTTTAESLAPFPPNIRVGAHRGDPARFELIPLDAATRVSSQDSAPGGGPAIRVHLGDVHVVRGAEISVNLAGDLTIDPASPRPVTGQIRLKRGGRLEVQGRRFTIDSGTVTFVDDPGNPQVVVKAGWKAPDRSTVFATFTGPLKTGKVTLSSEPPLPKEEIVQLVLFGSRGGQQVQTGGPENSAIATAGGEAAQPINHMLNQLGLGAVTAKVDTSQAANPRPQVEVQIARDLSFQIAVVLGQPPPGVNPDRTLFTVDWRFFSQWSLSTTVGDAGSTIFDLLWQHRY